MLMPVLEALGTKETSLNYPSDELPNLGTPFRKRVDE